MASARAADIHLPATFDRGLIFIRVTLEDGPPGLFVLDTGAAVTVLDTRFAAAARVPLRDKTHLRGGGGVVEARRAQDVRLKLYGGPVFITDPMVADLSPVGQGMGVQLDGIIGDDFLENFIVILDYRSGAVTLAEPNSIKPPEDAVPIRMAGTPFVSAMVEDAGRRQVADFQIDTGSNTAVEFWAPFAEDIFPNAPSVAGAGYGVAGRMHTERGNIDALVVAGQRIVRPSTNFADLERADGAGGGYGGVIGGPAWTGRVLTLDFSTLHAWVR